MKVAATTTRSPAALSASSLSLRELTENPPSRISRLVIGTVGALIAGLLIWSMVAELDIVATAPGRLVPESQVKVVQSSEPGIVREILVRDGDQVRAGQVLVRMDTTISNTDLRQLDHDIALRRITLAAIESGLNGRAMLPDPAQPAELTLLVSQQYAARLRALRDSVEEEEQAAQRARHDLIATQRVREKLASTLPSYRQSADGFARLQREGFVGELMANERQREFTEREQDLKAQEATVQAHAAAVFKAERRIAQLQSHFRSQLLTERVQAQADLARLQKERERAAFRTAELDVKAPHGGLVQGLATHTPGAVVQPGSQLLTVVPYGDRLRAEAVLANDDVGFVQAGQRAKVKFAAFPFQKYGLIEGTVVRLSADAEAPEAAARATGNHSAVPPLAFKAIIALDTHVLDVHGSRPLPVAPGMAVVVEIHQGRRSVMEYLLSPVQRVGSEAARER